MDVEVLPRRVRPDAMSDIFVTGIDSIELIGGGCARFTFYVVRTINGKTVRQIVPPSLVIEVANLPLCIKQASTAVAQHAARKFLNIGGDPKH
jgi:hypothetical protein